MDMSVAQQIASILPATPTKQAPGGIGKVLPAKKAKIQSPEKIGFQSIGFGQPK